MSTLELGAHLVTPRIEFGKNRLYDHHGIYVGDGKVIHYSGMAQFLKKGPIQETTLEDFKAGHTCAIEAHFSPKFSGLKAAGRARERLSEKSYNLAINNCEHFVNWCIEGDRASFQVERAGVLAAGSAAVPGGAILAWSVVPAMAASTVAGLSGPGLLSGLATIGGAVGGGAIAGIAALGAAPALAARQLINRVFLKDRDWHDENEKAARQAARLGSTVGAAAGSAGGLGSIYLLGSVVGFSGPGIASGLATIGGLLGGGMATGVAIAAAAPTLAAASGAYGVYRLAKWYNAPLESEAVGIAANSSQTSSEKPRFPEGDEASEIQAVLAILITKNRPMTLPEIATEFSDGLGAQRNIALGLLNGVRLGSVASPDGGETFAVAQADVS